MKVGDLVRHTVHSGALGIIVKVDVGHPLGWKVYWTNNNWGEHWEYAQNFEVIDEDR